jgi:hypothetical protein
MRTKIFRNDRSRIACLLLGRGSIIFDSAALCVDACFAAGTGTGIGRAACHRAFRFARGRSSNVPAPASQRLHDFRSDCRGQGNPHEDETFVNSVGKDKLCIKTCGSISICFETLHVVIGTYWHYSHCSPLQLPCIHGLPQRLLQQSPQAIA